MYNRQNNCLFKGPLYTKYPLFIKVLYFFATFTLMNTKSRGNHGENIACAILEGFNYKIIDRNYLTRQGEIDIIALKNNIIHFIEVKTTYGEYNPAENFHKTKLVRFLKTVKIYCYKHKISDEVIQIDLALVNVKQRRFNLITHANIYFH
ncbi:MAG: hypothetical protein RLZZ517_432 [Candidatus Parcubacteria bacterium]